MNNYKVSSPNIHTHGGWTPSSPSNCQFRAKREISPSHRPHGIAGGSGESDRVSSVDSVAKIRGGGTHGVEGGGLGSLLGRSKGGCGGQAGDEYGSRLHGSIVWVVVTRVENLCVGVWFGRRYTSISPASRGGEPPNLSNYLRISTARPPARLVVVIVIIVVLSGAPERRQGPGPPPCASTTEVKSKGECGLARTIPTQQNNFRFLKRGRGAARVKYNTPYQIQRQNTAKD